MKLRLYIGRMPKLGRRSRLGSSHLGNAECADLLANLPRTIEGLVDDDSLTSFRGEQKLRELEGVVDLFCHFDLGVKGFDPDSCSRILNTIQAIRSRIEARREEKGSRF